MDPLQVERVWSGEKLLGYTKYIFCRENKQNMLIPLSWSSFHKNSTWFSILTNKDSHGVQGVSFFFPVSAQKMPTQLSQNKGQAI